jgi:excisionase family DNA binding protein
VITLPEKELLRPDEVAAYFSVTRRTVYNWIKEGKLESRKASSLVRIYRDSVLELLQKHETV